MSFALVRFIQARKAAAEVAEKTKVLTYRGVSYLK
jgi:hypothetical protein